MDWEANGKGIYPAKALLTDEQLEVGSRVLSL